MSVYDHTRCNYLYGLLLKENETLIFSVIVLIKS